MREFFWKGPIKDYTQPPLTPEMIAEAECELGIKLPTSYLELLMIQNGGATRYDTFFIPRPLKHGDITITLSMLMGIGSSHFYTILGSKSMIEEWEMPEELVLLDGDGHTWTALDYRTCGSKGEPSIIWIDNELEEEIELAPNFETFVDRLVDGNYHHVMGFAIADSDPTAILQQINQYVNQPLVKVENPPQSIGWYKDASESYWFTSNQNSVGYYRYPWRQDCAWILECKVTPTDYEQLRAQLAESLPLVDLHTPDPILLRLFNLF